MKHLLIALATTVALFSCQSKADTAAAIEQARKATIDSINAVNVAKQQVIDSMNRVKTQRARRAAAAYSGNSYNAGENTAYDNTTAATPAAPAKKKGWKSWSHTAKGAVVGAGAGAVTGAIVNKDRLKGAAIGTLIGAGTGAATGAIVDHQKKKKAQQ
ncbi:YMGG-like glycine zipper-containing protein [Chitinophaga defluvii]|uniref:YMGG-like glycine zipper-containing protein n=1 Tax=Chitinophaga defluvii TaxID=3163343 RepID=A0ABV2T055_9BACT